jgi:hypothetical protein
MAEKAMIYGLIAQAMGKIGAIGKDSTATNVSGKKMYNFRGIDAVYNALNPVMAELGLFICPEVLEQTREERKTTSGGNLIYSILKIKFTMYAPDGSNVSCIVIGEGMDSGDKASNKAMSVALKYACFELFMIPTEEMVDPDAEVHEVAPRQTPQAPAQPAVVEVVKTIPAPPVAPVNPVLEYLAKEREALRVVREINKAQNAALFKTQTDALKAKGLVPNKKLEEFTQDEATQLIQFMYTMFDPLGTVLKNDGKNS